MANGKLRVLIAGGGSGGHVFPALAVARELVHTYGAQVRFVGTARGLETRLVPAAGFPLDLIQVGQLNQVQSDDQGRDAFQACLSAYWRVGVCCGNSSRILSSALAAMPPVPRCWRPF